MFGNNVLGLDAVGKKFGQVSALSDVTFSIDRGEILCLVGRSGCGKSTMLRLIGGIDRPDSGSIFLNGDEIAGPKQFIEPDKRQIGFVFQDYALFPHLSVEDNIAFGIRAMSRGDKSKRVGEMLELVGLETMAKRFAHSLSGGEQQRIALARALAPRPKLILLDEPFSNLDLTLKRRVRAETIELLRQVDATAIMVTHDPQEALSIGDHVVLLNEGRIVQKGTPDDLYHRPVDAYAASFFSEFNVIDGTITGGQVVTALGSFRNEKELPEGAKCRVFIRPSAVHFVSDVEGDGFAATLESRLFQGEREELTYRLDNPDILLKMVRLTGGEPAPVRSKLDIAHQLVLIFTR